jgi:hypothetical protein
MKQIKLLGILAVLVILVVAVNPVAAQLGDTDTSTFTVQNVSGGSASVTATFYGEDGTPYTPTDLGGGTTNPFTLVDGASKQINVANIPAAQLPAGHRYSLVISSTAQVIAQAGLAGSGSRRFGGSYVSFDTGASTVYIPSAAYNLSGWYSMFTIQNTSATNSADVTVSIKCKNSSTVGTLHDGTLPPLASVTWALKNTIPTNFTAATVCDGSAVITSTQPIVAVNNQNNPSTGATNSFEGASAGATTLYVANLSNGYFGWNSNLSIVKLDSGNTTVTVTYSDGDAPDTCNLTDAVPFCKLYQPANHGIANSRYGATITSSPANHMLAVAGSTNGSLSGAVSAVAGGTATVAIPNAAARYYGWNSAINCQVVGGGATALHVVYSGYAANAYDTTSLAIGGSKQILVANETFLPAAGWQGGVTITANNASAQFACTVGNTNADGQTTLAGDWTTQYNAYNK